MRTTAFRLSGWCREAIAAALLVAWIGVAGCSQEQAQTLTIAYSADLRGAIYPCDCPGKEYGGLGRRATFLEAVRDTAENLLILDGGDFFGREIDFGGAKAEIVMNSMALMGYDGMAVGESDFGFGVDYVVSRTAELGLPVLAANLYDAKTGKRLFKPSARLELPNGLEVGLIGVVGNGLELPPQVPVGALEVTDPVEAVESEVAAFEDGVDIVVVLAHLPEIKARGLAEKVPEIDLIVCGHDGRQPRKNRRFGNAFILLVPKEGTHAGVAHAIVGKDGGISSLTTDLTPLSERIDDHEAITDLIRSHGL
jgi:2',3'-cyclic-nucleotide 2'-phosphodiesterase (5'-nucleotidase family)